MLIDVTSIDLGHDQRDQVVVAAKIGEWNGLDVERYPTAEYKGTLGGFHDGAPTAVTGELTRTARAAFRLTSQPPDGDTRSHVAPGCQHLASVVVAHFITEWADG